MHENPETIEDQEEEEQSGYAPADEAEDDVEDDGLEEGPGDDE